MKRNNLIILRLLSALFNDHTYTKRFLTTVDSLLKNNGFYYTIDYLKFSKLLITRYICKKPIINNDKKISTVGGFPTKFLYFKKLIDSGKIRDKAFVLTLLSYSRSIKPSKGTKLREPLYETITNVNLKKNYTIPLKFINEFVEYHKLQLKKPIFENDNHYISNKSSPFGKATLSGLFGLFYLVNNDHQTLEIFNRILGSKVYDSIIAPVIKLVWTDHRSFKIGKVPKSSGKLSIVEDPEGKRRIIAMVDYYSQFILKPIHQQLLNLLNNLDCDRTFTQDPFHQWGKTMGNNFWSLDLSAATDRFPVELQEKLLSVIYGDKEFSTSWRDLLTSRLYEAPNGRLLKYSVGQPMGAYSSWAAFTLSHHLVVKWAAKLCGFDQTFNKYIILGDDIVINNDKVAQKYIGIMTKLGVDISMTKTHVSKNTYEFAKRWIHKGVEVSGLPLRGILNNLNNPITLITNIVEYIYRVNIPFKGTTVDLLYKVFKGIKFGNRFYSNSKILDLIKRSVFAIRYSKKILTYEEIRVKLLSLSKIEEFTIPYGDEAYLLLDRVFSLGLRNFVEKSSNSLKRYYERFYETFDQNFPKENLKFNPIVHGLYQKLRTMKASLQESLNSKKDLVDVIHDMRIDEPDKLVESVRNSSKQIIYLDRIWISSFKQFNQINENNYYNYPLSSEELFGAKPYESLFITSLSNQLNKLDGLRYGY
ncbi:RNA-dependent RNA polymerase [Diaporthe rudis mitovirus 1]|uniref:RNA-dependent RNA polymerase n=1 Tax=Diaporthe rudis mitovirus 1 TaxID=2767013 RepID=A0ABX6TQK4_9VIRU|nr:RNA-dependent RNA polymerase [Diaporthe rudis mitovirus 1]QNS28825.1 RNA-dependent RNA polymerase [Diaporthe rudis mitovirus 1]